MKFFCTLFLLTFILFLNSQTTNYDGDWKQRYVKMKNTAEAELMIRHGDMDNFGFGWPENYTPYSGKLTRPHKFPWKTDTTEVLGFDMIMVTSSYDPHPGYTHSHHDSYSKERHHIKAKYGKTVFELKMKQPDMDTAMKVNKIMLQLYVDDFQSAMTGVNYKVYINKKRAQFMEPTINGLKQNAHTGRLVTFSVPATFFNEFKKKEISLCIDDSTTGNGDGYAIDYVKILYNPTNKIPNGSVQLKLKDIYTHHALHNATITVLGTGNTDTCDAKGNIILDSIPTGDAFLQISSHGYPVANVGMEIYNDSTRHEVILVCKSDSKRTHVQHLMSHYHGGGTNAQINLHTDKNKNTQVPLSPNGNLNLLNVGKKK